MPSSLVRFHITLHPSRPSPPTPTSANVIVTSSAPLPLWPPPPRPPFPHTDTGIIIISAPLFILPAHRYNPMSLIIPFPNLPLAPGKQPNILYDILSHQLNECHAIYHPCSAHPYFARARTCILL